MKQNVALSYPSPQITNSDIKAASTSKSYPEKGCHTAMLFFKNKQDILTFSILLTFSYDWENF